MSLNSFHIPCWSKASCIKPAASKPHPSDHDDITVHIIREVILTAISLKIFKMVLKHITTNLVILP